LRWEVEFVEQYIRARIFGEEEKKGVVGSGFLLFGGRAEKFCAYTQLCIGGLGLMGVTKCIGWCWGYTLFLDMS
jgi:hypothetical protein